MGIFFHQFTNPLVSWQPIGYLPTKPTIIGFLTTSGYIAINHIEVGIFPSINQPLGVLLTTYWISSHRTTNHWVSYHQPTTNQWVYYHQPWRSGYCFHQFTNPLVSWQRIGYLPTKPTIIGFLTTSGYIAINHIEVGIFPSINQPLGVLLTTYWISSHRTTNHWVSYHQPTTNQWVYYHQPWRSGYFFHQFTNPLVSWQRIGYLPTKPTIIGFLTTSGYIAINHIEVGIFPSINQPLGVLLTTYWISSHRTTNHWVSYHQPTTNQWVYYHQPWRSGYFFHQLLTNPWVSYQQPIGYLPTKPNNQWFCCHQTIKIQTILEDWLTWDWSSF